MKLTFVGEFKIALLMDELIAAIPELTDTISGFGTIEKKICYLQILSRDNEPSEDGIVHKIDVIFPDEVDQQEVKDIVNAHDPLLPSVSETIADGLRLAKISLAEKLAANHWPPPGFTELEIEVLLGKIEEEE